MIDLLTLLKPNQRRGSKPRCHALTNNAVRRAAILSELIAPWGAVSPDDVCMPDGFRSVDEAQLHRAADLLSDTTCGALTSWWLAVSTQRAATPNWDIASKCTVDGQRGVLLVEAKAHHGELEKEESGKALTLPLSASSRRNHVRIGACIEEANIALTGETGRPWALARDHHYQMSNRFAWAWKLTELGVPVILVYLGFLGCDDMQQDSPVIRDHADWEQLVRGHSASIVPPECWERPWQLHGRAFVPLIRSLHEPLSSG
jgi:hypothetical protein